MRTVEERERLAAAPATEQRAAFKTIMACGGIVSALAASACCAIPLALAAVGVGGAWVGNLTALAPYQPIFVAVALAFLATGFVLVYRPATVACGDGSACATPRSGRLAKLGLWAASVLVVVALVFPYTASWLLDA
jgi:mercuric ion transport protein